MGRTEWDRVMALRVSGDDMGYDPIGSVWAPDEEDAQVADLLACICDRAAYGWWIELHPDDGDVTYEEYLAAREAEYRGTVRDLRDVISDDWGDEWAATQTDADRMDVVWRALHGCVMSDGADAVLAEEEEQGWNW